MINFTVMFFGNLIYLPDVPILFRPNVESQVENQPNHIVKSNSNQLVSVFNDVTPDWEVIEKWLNLDNPVKLKVKSRISYFNAFGNIFDKCIVKFQDEASPDQAINPVIHRTPAHPQYFQ